MDSRNEAGEARHGKIDGRICTAAPVEKRLPRQVDLPLVGRAHGTLGTLRVHVRGVGNMSKCAARTMHAKVRAVGGGEGGVWVHGVGPTAATTAATHDTWLVRENGAGGWRPGANAQAPQPS